MSELLRRLIAQIRSGSSTRLGFAHNVLWMILGLGLRTGIQIVYFVIVARTLGPETFGVFAGVQGLVMLFSAYASWGSGNIMIKRVSRHPETFPLQWGSAVFVTLTFSVLLSLIVFIIAGFVYSFETAFSVALPMAAGDLLGMSLVSISAQAFQAHMRLSRTSLMWILLTSIRLMMAVIILILPIPRTLENWALLYGASGLLAGVLTLLWIYKDLGWGRFTFAGMVGEWREGMFFSISSSAHAAYNDLDKILLSRLAVGAAAGAYAAAYRFLDVALIPVKALFYTSYPRFFQEGDKSLIDARHFALRLLPWAASWGVFAWLALAVISPLFTLLLGEEYQLVSLIVIWLGPILIFRALHNLAADTLTGAGFQGTRTLVQVCVSIINLVLNLWWIPLYSWAGAVWSSLVSDGIYALILWILLFKIKGTAKVVPSQQVISQ